jgi:CBS-domain-containing membrane protein
MNAADIMTKDVLTVRPDASVGEIATLLLDHKISPAPVIDDDRHVVRIVSEGDLLGQPPSGSPRAWWLRLFNDGESRPMDLIQEALSTRAGHIRRPSGTSGRSRILMGWERSANCSERRHTAASPRP